METGIILLIINNNNNNNNSTAQESMFVDTEGSFHRSSRFSLSLRLSFQYRHAFLKQQEEMQSLRELMLLKDNRIRLLEDELRHLKSHENDLSR